MIEKKVIFLGLVTVLVLFSCGDKGSNDVLVEDERRYQLTEVHSFDPIDLNFDGKSNHNLMEELPSLKNQPLRINFEHKTINIIWLEPRINDGEIGKLLDQYNNSISIDYLPVQNLYYFKNDQDLNIQPYQNLENTDYTFTVPKSVKLLDDDRLMFTTNQKFLTENGIRTVFMECVYEIVN